MNSDRTNQQFSDAMFRALLVLATLLSIIGMAIITWSNP